MHLTGGILRRVRAFSTPEQNPALRVLSTPAHPQVTQTVSPPVQNFGGIMTETKKETSPNKSLYIIIGVLAIIILILLGWRVAKVQLFGIELIPPTTSTPITIVPTNTSVPTDSPTSVLPASTITPFPTAIPFVLNIRPACGSEYTIETGKAIELHYGGWYADGLTLGIENANHLTVTLLIDGQEISGTKQSVQQVTASWFPGASCNSRDYSNAFGTFYIANIGTLTAGEHSVQVIYSFDTQVTDGGYDDNGNPNVYGPGELDPLQFTIVANP